MIILKSLLVGTALLPVLSLPFSGAVSLPKNHVSSHQEYGTLRAEIRQFKSIEELIRKSEAALFIARAA